MELKKQKQKSLPQALRLVHLQFKHSIMKKEIGCTLLTYYYYNYYSILQTTFQKSTTTFSISFFLFLPTIFVIVSIF